MTQESSLLKLKKTFPWILIIGGLVGLISAFIITIEKLHLLQNAAYTPSCDLNPIISCGSVMSSPQSAVFGFPNSLIGLIAFPIVITIGVLLLNKVILKRWIWLGLLTGTIGGLVFVHWLFFQSTYRINALCPYCIAVWIATITMFWYTLLSCLDSKAIILKGRLAAIGAFLRQHHLDILALWFIVIFVLIMKHFWYYYGPQLGF